MVAEEEEEEEYAQADEEEVAIVQAAHGGGVAQGAGGQGELAIVLKSTAVHRDIMKSRRFQTLWKANNLPDEAKVLIDQMEEERQKGAW